MNGSEHGFGGVSYYDPDLVVWVGEALGQQTGPGEVFIIPDIGGNKNMSQAHSQHMTNIVTINQSI